MKRVIYFRQLKKTLVTNVSLFLTTSKLQWPATFDLRAYSDTMAETAKCVRLVS